MPKYDRIRTAAWRPSGASDVVPLYTMPFPQRGAGSLLDLTHATQRAGADAPRTIQIRSLNRALRALVPDLVSEDVDATAVGRTWLYGQAAVRESALLPIVRAWTRAVHPNADRDLVDEVVAGFTEADFRWSPRLVDLSDWKPGDNGTATPADRALFRHIPAVLASRLSAPGVTCALSECTLKFRRAATPDDSNGAQLISWPPLPWRDSYFSVLLTLTVQTVPFQPYPVVYLETGVRRWMTVPVRFLGRGDTSVYVRAHAPWVESGDASESFQVARLHWTSQGIVWADRLPAILGNLRLGVTFPVAADVCSDPGAFIEANATIAALPFRTGMRPRHPAGAGLLPGDRRLLLEWAASFVGPQWELTDAPTRVHYRLGRPACEPRIDQSAPSQEEDPEDTGDLPAVPLAQPHQVVDAIRRVVGASYTVEIWYQDTAWRDLAVDTIRADLGAPTAVRTLGPESEAWEYRGLTVRIVCRALGAPGSPLRTDERASFPDRLHHGIQVRQDEVAGAVASTEVPTGVLVELYGKAFFSRQQRGEVDPKFALRRGLALTGRHSQFATPLVSGVDEQEEDATTGHRRKDSARVRLAKSWRDLLRQHGVLLAAPSFTFDGMAAPVDRVVAWWVVRQQRRGSPTRAAQQVPVAVLLDLRRGEVLARGGGMTTWLPYGAALLELATGEPYGGRLRRPDELAAFFDATVSDLDDGIDTLVITHAQNLRSALPWIGNGRIGLDTFAGIDISRYRGLRHARLRTNVEHETPEYYGTAADGVGIGLPSGVWLLNGSDRLFGSTARKPATSKLSPRLSKLGSYVNSSGTFDRKPNKYAWNPQLVEIAISALQPRDVRPQHFAALVHELRSIAIHHTEPFTLPLPCHLAQQTAEYLLPIEEDEDVAQ
jgi:hypothetical protein